MKKILALSCLSLMIAACTQTDSAEIEDISDSSGGSTVYTKPPANISTGAKITTSPAVYSAPQTLSNSTSAPATASSSNTVTTKEHNVYNRNYGEIPKGGYQGDTYTVKRGDTLYYIAWVTGNDYRSLAAKNNIKEPYAVNVGQVLDVSGGTTVVVTEKTTTGHTATAKSSSSESTSSTTSAQTHVKPVMTTTTTTTTTTSSKTQPPKTTQTTETVTEPVDESVTETTKVTPIPETPKASNSASISWQWPAKGKIIEKFSNASKGIDISGSLGDKIMAAADGRVVYSGNALPGYGNLIIIKHNDDYLTAYAHNQSILVKEQQSVRAGEQIATMGATGTSSVRLHFEIRYKAQSVDPLKYLSN
nr:murein hydrolase activator NlpD [Gilliamella apicola]